MRELVLELSPIQFNGTPLATTSTHLWHFNRSLSRRSCWGRGGWDDESGLSLQGLQHARLARVAMLGELASAGVVLHLRALRAGPH